MNVIFMIIKEQNEKYIIKINSIASKIVCEKLNSPKRTAFIEKHKK